MATEKQVGAAKRNIQTVQRAAKRRRTFAHLPEATRRDLGRQASKARTRGGRARHALERASSSTNWRRSATSADVRSWASRSSSAH